MHRLPAAAVGDLRRLRHQLAGQAEARAGRGIVEDAPAGALLLQPGGIGELLALVGIENAALLAAVALLKSPNGQNRGVAEIRAGDAVVVAGPDEVEQDRRTLVLGHGGIL